MAFDEKPARPIRQRPRQRAGVLEETSAGRIRRRLGKRAGLVEKTMWGEFAFFWRGNMCGGGRGGELMGRLAREQRDRALSERHTRLFDLTGRPMKGWILVEPKGL